MLIHYSSQKQNNLGQRAQAIVEFAIVLPILMMLLVGLLEVGRMIFMYSAVNNASREAARYASAFGLDDDGLNHYNNCPGVRTMARNSAYFMNLQDGDIDISFDDGPGTTVRTALCNGTDDDDVESGDRVTVTITTTYSPMVNLVPIGSRPIISASSRTILGIFELEH
jgi:Flp pilus assembly protein TadG